METTIDLKKDDELRIFSKPGLIFKLHLKSGNIDLFGAPLPCKKELTIPSENISLYAQEPSTLFLNLPQESSFYISKTSETPSYYKSFLSTLTSTPTQFGLLNIKSTLVIGSRLSGKTSLCQTYCNYFLKKAIHPIYVDLDLQRNSLTIPGCLSSSKISDFIYSFNLFQSSEIFSYFIGTVVKATCMTQYKKAIQALAEIYISGYLNILHSQSNTNNYKNLYFVINLNLGSLKEMDCLNTVLKAFKVRHIMVLEQEKIVHDLNKYFKENHELEDELGSINIIKLNKSKGIAEVEEDYTKNYKNDSIVRYFYGCDIKGHKYYPHKRVIDFKNIEIYKRSKKSNVPSSALPLTNISTAENEFYKVNCSKYAGLLKNSVLAISSSKASESFDVKPVYGFFLVSDVLVEKKKIVCLAICLNELPNDKLVVGEIRLKSDGRVSGDD